MKLRVRFPRITLTPLAVKGLVAAYFRTHHNRPESQETFILSHTKKHADTAFGVTYELGNIESIEEFQHAIPLQHYETTYPWIERCLRGEKDILLRGKIEWFATSSGTTGKNKYIPVTRVALKQNHYHAGIDLMMHYAKANPHTKMWQGQGLGIGGGFSYNPFTGKKNIGFISAILQKHMPIIAKMMKQPKAKVSYLSDWQKKIEKMISVTTKKNITSISGQPSWCSAYLEKLLAHTKAKNILEVWPHFELVIWGGMAMDLYKPIFEALLPSPKVNYYQVYNASEGFFAAQHENNRDDMLLFVEHGIFYEFISLENYLRKEYSECITLKDVQVGKPYVIVITNNAGLRRYVLGDVVEFTGTQPFTLKITGRTKYYIDVAGECTPLEPIEEALHSTAQTFGGVMKEFTVGPAPMKTTQGYYELMIEWATTPSCSQELFAKEFDAKLCELWSYYSDERVDTHMLADPVVHFVPEGTFYRWLEQRGKLGGQHKVPKVCSDRQILEEIERIATSGK